MKIQCDITAPCPDDANPVQNLSSEAPDVNHFFAYGSGPGSVSGRPTGPGSTNDPGSTFSAQCQTQDGPITCVGTTQQEADLCVIRMGMQCNDSTPGVPPTTPEGEPLYPSTLQQCSASCPDGTPFTFQVAAGFFVETSQILADREAQSYACRQAQLLKVCLGALSNTAACVGRSYSGTFTVSGTGAFTFTVVSGSLPPGVTLSSSGSTALLAGTPTTPGNYTFSIRATNTRGNSIVKAFTIFVLGFTNSNPTAFVTGTPYSFTFTASGGTAPYAFTQPSGTLPTGLTLASNGTLSGTPTAAGTFNFGITVTDAAGRTCQHTYSVTGTAAITGYQICNWPEMLATLQAAGAFAGFPLSAAPAWNGIFDKSITDSFGNTYWYFTGQSIDGRSVSGDETPDYPTYPDWVDNDCWTFIQINDLGITPPSLVIQSTTCVMQAWSGAQAAPGTNPSGDYTSGTSPMTVSVRATGAVCCPSPGDPVPAVFNPASPARVRIQNYTLAYFGNCPGCAPSVKVAWDGTFPLKCSTGPANLSYLNAGGDCAETIDIPGLSINGFDIQNGNPGDKHHRIQISFHPIAIPPRWELEIFCEPPAGPDICIWGGNKQVGDTPQGVYTRGGTPFSPGVAATPDCITVESY